MLFNPDPGTPQPTAVVTADDLQGHRGLADNARTRTQLMSPSSASTTRGWASTNSRRWPPSTSTQAARLPHAARLLINTLEQNGIPEDHVFVPTQLVERESMNVPFVPPSREEA